MDEQWFAEQPVESDVEPAVATRPRVTWEDVWGGLEAAKASTGNLALAFEDVDADEWGFALGGSPDDDDSDGDPVQAASVDPVADDEVLADWQIPALASFDAVIDQSPASDEDVGRDGYGPAGDDGGFDLDDEPSGPLAFSTPSAPPAWRQTLGEPEPDSPPEASPSPAMDASSVSAPAAPAPAPVPVPPPAPYANSVTGAPAPSPATPVAAAPAAPRAQIVPPAGPAARRSVEDIFGDDLFDEDDEGDDDEEPRGEATDPFAGAADLPERWMYSSRRRIAGRRRRQGRTARPARRERRRRGRSPFEEIAIDPGLAPALDEFTSAPAGRAPESHPPAGRAPDSHAPAGRAPEDRAPAGRGRARRRGMHRHRAAGAAGAAGTAGAAEAWEAAPRSARRFRASIVRLVGVSVPLAAAVVVYLRLS